MKVNALPKPLWEGRGVVLYHGEAEDLGPRLHEPGMFFMDPPYSAHVHEKSRAGGRSLKDGNGRMTKAALSRQVDFGFGHLTPELQLDLARTAARLSRRWTLVFCDLEGVSGWREALEYVGLDYRRTVIWDKEGSTPQFTGDQPAVAVEAIVCAHPFCGKGRERRRWNGGGNRGIYHIPIETDRFGATEKRINETQKPLPLIEAVLRDFAEPPDLVYDLVAGGGTTGVAALRVGLRSILVERRKEQAEKTAARLEAEARKPRQIGLMLVGKAPAMKQGDLFSDRGGAG